jgi:TolB protein
MQTSPRSPSAVGSLKRLSAWGSVLGTNAWSPDGEELAFSRLQESGEVALWKVNLATRGEPRLTTPPPAAEDGWGSWSPDGRSIVFRRNDKGSRMLWQVPAEGGEATLLFGEPAGQPAWFPDGRRIAFRSARSGASNRPDSGDRA